VSWAGTPAAPPEGYELATLRAGDTLADLEAEEAARRGLKSKADVDRVCLEITAANGLDGHKAKSCAWARDVASWVLGTGGQRAPVVATQRNTCEPGKGFPMFVGGQRIEFFIAHQTARLIINSLILPIAFVGFKPLGQTSTQFMMVWQRNNR
jgi:hypothetical protein